MSVYNRFKKSDIIHYNLDTAPRVTLVSGSSGWDGSTGLSGSLSMYGGIRSRTSSGITIRPIYNLDSFTKEGKSAVSASYPLTGSVSYVQVVDRSIDSTLLRDDFWGDEHFRPILNLYDYYSRVNSDYTTASYDYYCLYSDYNSTSQKVAYAINSANERALLDNMSASFTIEMRIKPLTISGSGGNYTIANQTNRWEFYIDDSNGKLAFSASDGFGSAYTSSLAVTQNRWQHVGFNVSGSVGYFTIDMKDAGSFPVTGNLDNGPVLGNVLTIFSGSGMFHGFGHELKVWKLGRSWLQMSSSFDRTLIDSSSADLAVYARFNDGPLSAEHGFAAASGVFNYRKDTPIIHGQLLGFNTRVAPIWHPCDDQNFITVKNLVTGSVNEFRVIHIPSLYYGRSIMTGSVRVTCNSFLSSSLMRTLVDDGRGGLYLSGSAVSASLQDREEYAGVKWNKVGNVFYNEGLIVIKDPAMLDFAQPSTVSPLTDDLLQIEFRGQQRIPTKVFMCRINGAHSNASNNPSFVIFDSGSGKNMVIRDTPITYVTSVGLYNKERKLVAVAKVAQPIRNREIDKLNIRLKMDF